MNRPSYLSPVPEDSPTPSNRIKRLQAEARSLASEQVTALADLLTQIAQQAEEIIEAGIAPVGAREVARRVAEEAKAHGLRLEALRSRQP